MNIKNDIFYVDENMKYLESVIIDYKKIESKEYKSKEIYAIPEIVFLGCLTFLITSLIPATNDIISIGLGLLIFTMLGCFMYFTCASFTSFNPKDSILSHFLKKHEIYEKSIEDENTQFKLNHSEALKFICRIHETENLSNISCVMNHSNITDIILDKLLMKDDYKVSDLADFYHHHYLVSNNENNIIPKKIKSRLLDFQDDKSLIEQLKSDNEDVNSFNKFKSVSNNLLIKKF
jgi:hypothetical protein